MSSAGTGGTAGQDLAALGQVTAELDSVFEIDVRHLINAEGANLLTLARMNTIISHCHSESSYLWSCGKMLEREIGIVVGEHGEIRRSSRDILRGLICRLLRRNLIEALRVALRLVERTAVSTVALAVAEIDIVGNDLRRAALIAFLVLPVADLQPYGPW